MGTPTYADLLADQLGVATKLRQLKHAVAAADSAESAAFIKAGDPYLATFRHSLEQTYKHAGALSAAITELQPQGKRPSKPLFMATVAVLRGSTSDGSTPVQQWHDLAPQKKGLTAISSPWYMLGVAACGIAGELQGWDGSIDVSLRISKAANDAWTRLLADMKGKKSLPYFIAAFLAEHGSKPDLKAASRMSALYFLPPVSAWIRCMT